MAKNFYGDLFTTQEVLDSAAILDHVPVKVTQQMNEELGKPFTADEVGPCS